MIASTNDNPIWEEDEDDELDRLLEYARTIKGDRAVHSVYEVLDLIPQFRRQNVELSAALIWMKHLAKEMDWFVAPLGLSDKGPNSEFSRWCQCRANVDAETDPKAILAAHDAAKNAEIVELSAGLRLAHEQMLMTGMPSDVIEQSMGREACRRALTLQDRKSVV